MNWKGEVQRWHNVGLALAHGGGGVGTLWEKGWHYVRTTSGRRRHIV